MPDPRCYFGEWYRYIAILLCLIIIGACQASDPVTSSSDPTPVFGDSLRKEIEKTGDEANRLTRAITDAESEESRLQIEIESLSKSLQCPVVSSIRFGRWFLAIGLILLSIWVCGLYFMLVNVERPFTVTYAPVVRKLLYAFLIVTALCLMSLVSMAAQDDSSLQAPGQNLVNTLQQLKDSGGMEQWRQTLRSLEESRCVQVDLPESVLPWIAENCPEAELVNPIIGQGPHRATAIAAILWASGDRKQALDRLKQVIEIPFHPRLAVLRPCYRSAIRMYAADGNKEIPGKLMRQMLPFMEIDERLDMADLVRECCPDLALELVHSARQSAHSLEEVMRVAQSLMELGRPEETGQWMQQNIQLTLTRDGFSQFLDFTRQQRLSELELQLLQQAMMERRTAPALLDLAEILQERNQIIWAKRVMQRTIETETSSEGLIRIARTALSWNQLDVAQSALRRAIDLFGFEGALQPFADPGIPSDTTEKLSRDDPSVAVIMAKLTELLGDTESARSMYIDALNIELFNAVTCGGDMKAVNFTNFYYAWCFFRDQHDSAMLAALESGGQDLEQNEIKELANRNDALVNRLESLDVSNTLLRKTHSDLKTRWIEQRITLVLLTIYSGCMMLIMLAVSIYILIRAVRFGRSLPHTKTLGGVLKAFELKGYILLPSLLAPIGVMMIAHSQLFQSIMWTAIRLLPVKPTNNPSAIPDLPIQVAQPGMMQPVESKPIPKHDEPPLARIELPDEYPDRPDPRHTKKRRR